MDKSKYVCATCFHAGEGGILPGMGLCLNPQMFKHNMTQSGQGPSRVFARLICAGFFWESGDGAKRPHWTKELYRSD